MEFVIDSILDFIFIDTRIWLYILIVIIWQRFFKKKKFNKSDVALSNTDYQYDRYLKFGGAGPRHEGVAGVYNVEGIEGNFVVDGNGVLYIEMEREDGSRFLRKYEKSNIDFIISKDPGFPGWSTSNSSNIQEWNGNGSGFFVSEHGHIATNFHVIKDAQKIGVEFRYKNKIVTFNAEVRKSDKINDLAILQIEDSKFESVKKIPFKISAETRSDLGIGDLGSEVFALGFPMALNGMGKDIKFTDGRISSKSGPDGDVRYYQTTTPIQGGNSGGPLFDFEGNLIAINTLKFISVEIDNVSFSIKSSFLHNLIDSLPETINIPKSTSLKDKPLKEQIKILKDFVVLIKVKSG
jgi:S1-C subfamily serine protease